MTEKEWDRITGFSPIENWGDPDRMDVELLFALASWKRYINKTVIILCGFEERASGYHPSGLAVDCFVPGVSLFDQFITASRFPAFRGIGLYSWWRNLETNSPTPGLHLDTRPKKREDPRDMWGSTAPYRYTKVTKEFLYGAL